MSYGQNAPQGLQAVKNLVSGAYNSQISTYLIKSGYNQNIFNGDPVIVAGATGAIEVNYTGYLISIYDAGVQGSDFTTTATLGIFAGCSFQQSNAQNPIDPASPGRMYWPAGQITFGNIPATANVIDDPNVVFNVQTSTNPGAAQTNIGSCAPYVFTATANIVQGNTNSGYSQVSIGAFNRTQVTTANTIIKALLPSPPNPPYANPAIPGGNAYNNVEVLIQNHQYAQRAVPSS